MRVLLNAVEALCGEDAAGPAGQELISRAKEEATVLHVAGITSVSGAEIGELRRDAVELQPLPSGSAEPRRRDDRGLGSPW